MGRTYISAVAVIAWVMMSVPAHAAITIDGATAFVRGATEISSKSARPKENQAQAMLVPGDTVLTTSVSVKDRDKQGDKAVDRESVTALFANPDSDTAIGLVEFAGRTRSSVATKKKTIAAAFSDGSSFDYDFTLTGNYLFDMEYAYQETDLFDPDNYFQLINLAGGPPIFSDSPADGSFRFPNFGETSVVLGPGSYEFGIVTRLGDFSGVQGPGTDTGRHVEQYAFVLSAVPEPGTWLMMIAGFGLVGLGLRRRDPIPTIR